ncbi:MAG: UDP-2,3-diacylglucosamine diphosphatase LpxI [Hyphomicrobiales bacterium]|nr:UDP-2,3-diacylglucosamine diphosphatase LpxI [Hyphomicrobiales bacterium]
MNERPEPAHDPVAIVCGGGSLPLAVATAIERSGRSVVLFPIRGWAEPELAERFRHHWLVLATLGRFRRLARQEGCRDVVLIGNAVRPAVRDLRIDWLTLRKLPGIIRMFRGGDDHLLSGVAKVFEEMGFRVLSAHELAPEILVGEGQLAGAPPSTRDEGDIACGLALIAAMAPFDVGQAVVVADNRILAVEAAEGTDRMLERIVALRAEGRLRIPENSGVLVKAPKAAQDRRFDLPSMGPLTVEKVAHAKLAGIAMAAGETIVAEPVRVVEAANRAGLFVVGRPLAKGPG